MMNRKMLIIGAIAITLGACAKKQVVRPEPQVTPPASEEETEMSRQEPSIRFSDWRAVPELGAILFDYDQADLMDNARAILKRNADYLKNHPEASILVEGYCDERGTIEYNLALGQRRAAAVREYYGQLGVPLGRIGTISYGEEKPVDPSQNEAAWSKNRRAETKVRAASEAMKQ
ncbi:MAG: peptidoglycan-associated lipoprotein [Elusimicrobia bacterium RIFOXYB2_FULL_49_7]|nr:MAG: peptidoglycan-associated lipoprotein [Elusimicrobia bacterium RIFOXYB2_FULL_49_7]